MVGKWHLGHADKKFWPQNRGFDHFYGNLIGEVDYFTKERGGLIDWQRDGKFLKEDGYYTTLIGNEAVSIIETPRYVQAAVPVLWRPSRPTLPIRPQERPSTPTRIRSGIKSGGPTPP